MNVSLDITDELVDRIAERVADLLAERSQDAGEEAGDEWLRGAGAIANYISAPVSRVYALNSAGRIPLEKDGANLIAKKSDLDAWLRQGGGVRP